MLTAVQAEDHMTLRGKGERAVTAPQEFGPAESILSFSPVMVFHVTHLPSELPVALM